MGTSNWSGGQENWGGWLGRKGRWKNSSRELSKGGLEVGTSCGCTSRTWESEGKKREEKSRVKFVDEGGKSNEEEKKRNQWGRAQRKLVTSLRKIRKSIARTLGKGGVEPRKGD